ncbi:MAG: type II toxin-antitoxin system HicB family antitoxin [Methanomicrobia archaeon]|nr:type II toxin-antitoxin system HicB family antitoxin [Methanomicrobia archaeon]
MKYAVILEKEEEGGYSAQCLELPGAISQGETKEEALRNIKEAIEAVLEVLTQEAKVLGAVAGGTKCLRNCHLLFLVKKRSKHG